MLQKGYFLATMDSNAVPSLFPYPLYYKETESPASGRAWTLWDWAVRGREREMCFLATPTLQTKVSL